MSAESIEIDHVVVGVADLDTATARLQSAYGLVALPGGSHPSWGTANRIVPLGPAYLELVAVVDPVVARESAFGTWVDAMARGEAAWGWAARSSDLDATAARLGLDIALGSRLRPDGLTLTWRLAGVPDGPEARTRPFFIHWGEDVAMPGYAEVAHRVGEARIATLQVAGDPATLREWLGGDVPGVEVARSASAPGVTAILLDTEAGPRTIAPPL